jgi:hypothetical protein
VLRVLHYRPTYATVWSSPKVFGREYDIPLRGRL